MITLDEAKDILRVDGTDNDGIITAICDALPSIIETHTGMSEAQQMNNAVVTQLYGFFLRKLYYADQADDLKLNRTIDALLKIVTIMAKGQGPILLTRSITENGTYTALEDGADGYKEINVHCIDKWEAKYRALFDGTGEVIIPEGTTRIRNNLYNNAEVSGALVIPNGVVHIDDSAFQNCKGLTSLVLPDTVELIDSYAFYNCTGLTGDLIIPAKLTKLDSSVFGSCSGLDNIVIRRTEGVVSLYSSWSLNGTKLANGTAYAYVPDDLVEAYKVATNWVAYADNIKPLSEYSGGIV